MNIWFLAAAFLSAFTCGLHVVLGGRDVARPLLASSALDPAVKFTNYYCWHLVTIAIAALAAAFAYAARAGAAPDLALFASVVALFFGLWDLAMIVWFRLSPIAFGQWALFLPIGALGLIGALQ